MKTWTYIDKTNWARGEWDTEPDKVQYIDKDTGFTCLIVRVPHSGHLCGYVGVPEEHCAYKKNYNDVSAEVHGGLTFSDSCQESPEGEGICHVPEPGEPEHVWWLGFDCAHCGDYSSMAYPIGLLQYSCDDEVYRNIEFVKSQCSKLALQLQDMQHGD